MQLPRRDQVTAHVHREWLKKVARTTRKPLTRIAKEINISPSTLTRPVSEGDNGTSTLHARTIAKIVEHTGVEPPKAITGSANGRTPISLGVDAVPFEPDKADPVTVAVSTLIAGRNGLSALTLHTHALELAGYLPDDIVIVDYLATPQPGDIVLAEVQDWGQVHAGTVLRVLQRAATVDLLVPRSTDPTLQPLVVDRDRVVIRGVILPHRLRATGA